MKWIDCTDLAPTWRDEVNEAGAALKAGDLVIMPTETVYGLAANALSGPAVQKIFALKGRPSDNPLIVHIARTEDVLGVATSFPGHAKRLAEAFWPGPLTFVLPKTSNVPTETTAGLETVAVRFTAHPVAQALVSAGGGFVAAPSANPFMGLSPTRAGDVAPEILAGVATALDGGPCTHGIESTVIDLTGEPTILRPGSITAAEIATVLGFSPLVRLTGTKNAPGMYRRHYAPRTPVVLAVRLEDKPGIGFGPALHPHQFQLPADPQGYAQLLYATLAELDRLGLEKIFVEIPPDSAGWSAIRDRLSKATG